MRVKLWPAGLVGRVGLVLFAAVLLETVGSTILFEQAEVLRSNDDQAQRIAERIDSAARIIGLTDPDNRTKVAHALSQDDLVLTWSVAGDKAAAEPGGGSAGADRLRRKMIVDEPALARRDLTIFGEQQDADLVNGVLQLPDGSSLAFRSIGNASPSTGIVNQIWSIGLLAGCVLLAALLVVRTLALPLRMLVKATDAMGHGPRIEIQEGRGPGEVRRVARAFNAMQDRIAKLVTDRTEALAAVSHDLRTPLGRMRLRAGLLASAGDGAAFEADLDEMEAMLNDLLAYLGGETDPEKERVTNIAGTLATLVDAANDAGHRASYAGPDRLTLTIRPLAMKRAISNIINNAIAYGGEAHVTLSADLDLAVIGIEDSGPGIPEAELGAVFEPFFRGDVSRNRQTGGMGLGLAIARQAVWREHGTIELANRSKAGLRVSIILPVTT